MQHQKKLREQYIQLVESFITALESGKSGSELEDIRNEIRSLSSRLGVGNSVENPTQPIEFLGFQARENENQNGPDRTIS